MKLSRAVSVPSKSKAAIGLSSTSLTPFAPLDHRLARRG
jgi:hypothetical protein